MLRTYITALLVAGTALLSSCSSEDRSEQTSGPRKAELSFAMSGLYKPFNYKKGGELVGFDVDIGNEICKRLNRTAKPVTNPWQTIIQGLKSEKFDVILGSMAITEKRLEQVAFSRPYYRSGAQIFVGSDNTAVQSKADLKGKKIGVVKASTFRDIAAKLTDEENVIGYDSDVIALQDLTTGRTHAVITDKVVGLSAMKENQLPIKEIGQPLYEDRMGIAVRKTDTALLAKINEALEMIIKDGTYEKISQKWFGRNILGE